MNYASEVQNSVVHLEVGDAVRIKPIQVGHYRHRVGTIGRIKQVIANKMYYRVEFDDMDNAVFHFHSLEKVPGLKLPSNTSVSKPATVSTSSSLAAVPSAFNTSTSRKKAVAVTETISGANFESPKTEKKELPKFKFVPISKYHVGMPVIVANTEGNRHRFPMHIGKKGIVRAVAVHPSTWHTVLIEGMNDTIRFQGPNLSLDTSVDFIPPPGSFDDQVDKIGLKRKGGEDSDDDGGDDDDDDDDDDGNNGRRKVIETPKSLPAKRPYKRRNKLSDLNPDSTETPTSSASRRGPIPTNRVASSRLSSELEVTSGISGAIPARGYKPEPRSFSPSPNHHLLEQVDSEAWLEKPIVIGTGHWTGYTGIIAHKGSRGWLDVKVVDSEDKRPYIIAKRDNELYILLSKKDEERYLLKNQPEKPIRRATIAPISLEIRKLMKDNLALSGATGITKRRKTEPPLSMSLTTPGATVGRGRRGKRGRRRNDASASSLSVLYDEHEKKNERRSLDGLKTTTTTTSSMPRGRLFHSTQNANSPLSTSSSSALNVSEGMLITASDLEKLTGRLVDSLENKMESVLTRLTEILVENIKKQ